MKQTISKDIFQKYSNDIEKLEIELQNKEQSITNYNNILIELKCINNA